MLKYFTTIALILLSANCIIAKVKWTALDHCTTYNEITDKEYSNFFKTKTVAGKTTINFYVLSSRTPHIQLNEEPKQTRDYYEVVLNNGNNEVRRRRAGASYIVLGKATRINLIDQFIPLKVRVETKLQDGKRLLQVFVRDEKTALLTGVDPMKPLNPLYQAYGSYKAPSKFFFDCKPIPPPRCPALEQKLARRNTTIKSFKNEVERLLRIIRNAFNQSIRARN